MIFTSFRINTLLGLFKVRISIFLEADFHLLQLAIVDERLQFVQKLESRTQIEFHVAYIGYAFYI